VVENVAHGFRKPNILDVKLGTVLYDEDASPAKRERMLDKARRTTSWEAGIRLTGFQVLYTRTHLRERWLA
jgi:inositol-polyphosphate multikinase